MKQQQDQDIEDVKNLQSTTSGSLFLSSATKTTEAAAKGPRNGRRRVKNIRKRTLKAP